ncbi:hypothetical protein Y032_0735g1935 [Ancylostoma ceylanicum]|uniref:Uncharacterized protein n=1 Tax=Ancylostoma ceylanicum TaxID=53326 RepID=A0A016WED1_9BILA|nr:hypothetical protein Y032_0735g1935 [Ancylostoma ceylanicum]
MVYGVSLVLKMAGYRSPGAKGAPAPCTVESAEIRDHQWVVLAGSSVENAKDMGPPSRRIIRSIAQRLKHSKSRRLNYYSADSYNRLKSNL